MNRAQRFFSIIGLIFISILLMLGLAEIATRALLRPSLASNDIKPKHTSITKLCKGLNAPYTNPKQCQFSYDELAFEQYAPYFGYLPVPKYSGNGYHTNAQHFRYDEDLTRDKLRNEYRIFVTGGSTAWGAGVNQQQLYSTLLEHKLQQQFPNKKIRVIATGVGGYFSLHEVLMIKNYILDYKPDAIIMFTGWNDTYGGYRGIHYLKNPDMLGITQLLQKAPTSQYLQLTRLANTKSKSSAPPKYDDYSIKLNYLAHKVLYKLHHSKSKMIQQTKQQLVPIPYLVNYMIGNIELAHSLAKEHHIKFIVYLQPTLYNTKKTLTSFEQKNLKQLENQYPLFGKYNHDAYTLLRERLRSLAKHHHFSYLDADNAIMNSKQALFIDHVHFGDRGNTLIANDMYTRITPILFADHIQHKKKMSLIHK